LNEKSLTVSVNETLQDLLYLFMKQTRNAMDISTPREAKKLIF